MNKVIDFNNLMLKIDELKIWIFTNQRDEMVVSPVVPPVIPPIIPPVVPPGTWTAQVNSAIKVNTKNYLNDFQANAAIPQGSTTYFLIDHKACGIVFPGMVTIVIEEESHGLKTVHGLRIAVMELDANNNLLYTWGQPYVTGGMSQVVIKNFTLAKYNAGGKFLVRIIEPGDGNTTMNIKLKG